MTEKQAKAIIKRANQRLVDLENKDLKDSTVYKKLVTEIKLSGFTITSKGRLSSSKENIEKMVANPQQLEKIDKMPTLQKEIKRAKAYGAKTTAEIYENIRQRGKLETWAEENLEYVYDYVKAGVEEAIELQNAFDNGLRSLTYEHVWDLIARYEKAVAERNKIFADSEDNKGFFEK